MRWHRVRIFCALAAFAFAVIGTCGLIAQITTNDLRVVELIPGHEPDPLSSPYILGYDAQGKKWDLRLFRDVNEKVQLVFNAPQHMPIRVASPINGEWKTFDQVVIGESDLTALMPERGEFFVHVHSPNNSTPFHLRLLFARPPQKLNAGCFAFFLILSAVCWTALAWFLLPIWDSIQSTSTYNKWRYRVSAYALGAIVLLIVLDPHWWRAKDFDDQYAMGPAGAMARHGFDADRLFFRARVRPAFPAFSLPLQYAFPLQFISTSKWNTDNWKRWFDKYDRPGPNFAHFLYLENTLVALALLLGSGFLVGQIGNALGLGRVQALVASAIALLLLWHILDNVITTSFTTALIWTAPAALLWALQKIGWIRFLAAGIVAGAAVLAKETAISVAGPIAFLLCYHVLKGNHRVRRIAEIAIYAGASLILPLAYYLFIIPGGFGNVTELFREHAFQQQLYPHSFIDLTFTEAMKNLWKFCGPLPIVAVAGLVCQRKREQRFGLGVLVLLTWTFSACTIFFSPYVLPRFFVDFIPPLTCLAALTLPKQ